MSLMTYVKDLSKKNKYVINSWKNQGKLWSKVQLVGMKVNYLEKGKLKIVMNGAGAAGLSVSNLLISYGFTNLIVCDTAGAIFTGRPKNMNAFKNDIAAITNPNKINGNF